MEQERNDQQTYSGMPPKMAFLFGVVCAVAVMSIIILAAMLSGKLKTAGASGTTKGADTAVATNTAPSQPNVDIKNVKTNGQPFIGKDNAPVTMAVWEDFQCPFCKRWEQSTLPTLITDYVDKGKLKIVYKDFAFLGADSTTAAIAGRAVWEVAPKKYEEWRDAMYVKQDDENANWGSKDDIITLTKGISGIDANKVSSLMESKKAEYQKSVDGDRTEGGANGVNGTPGFVIGKQLIAGAEPIASFTAAIDALLK